MLREKSKAYLTLLAAELLCIVLLLPGCFQKNELLDSFFGEDILEMVVQAGDHLEFSGDRFSLTPGVYRVCVQTNLAEGQNMFVELRCESSYFNTLHSNGVTFFSGNDHMDFHVYALDKVPAAYVECRFYGGGPKTLVKLEVYRTSLGNRMLLFIALLVFGVADLLIEFRRRILEGKVSRKKQVVFWALAAGVLLACFPYLSGYFYMGADTTFHMSRIAGLADSISQGTAFPVRIQSGWLYNHGYAVSLFYGDLFLLFPVGLLLMGFSIMAAYKMYLFAVLVVMALIAYHSFYRCVEDEYAALLGSMVYLLNPYHIVALYYRSALGEVVAMAFLPLVCCGMYLLYTKNAADADYRKYKWYIVWGVSGVLLNHMISTEMVVAFMAVFCAVFWKKTFRRETFLQLLEATGIVLLVNMWFWLPFIYMMGSDVYRLQGLKDLAVQDKGRYFAEILQLLPNQGMGDEPGLQDGEPMHEGAGAFMLLCVYGVWCVGRKKQDKVCTVLAGLSVSAVVLSTRLFPWDAVTGIPGVGYAASSLQFPWRWMTCATVFVSLFVSFFFRYAVERGGMLIKAALGIASALVVGSAVYHVNCITYQKDDYYLYAAENMGTINVGQGEYLLAEAGEPERDMYYHDPVAETGLYWSEFEQRGTKVTLALENATEETRYMEIPLMGYKGYGIKTLGTEAAGTGDSAVKAEEPYITEEAGTHGDLRIAVPGSYRGKVQVSYQGFPAFHVAEAVSLASLALILAGYFYSRRRRAG